MKTATRPQELDQKRNISKGQGPRIVGHLFFFEMETDQMWCTQPKKSEQNVVTLMDRKKKEELLKSLGEAVQKQEVDASIIGAAMQKCGHFRWWDALLEVHEVLLKLPAIKLHYIEKHAGSIACNLVKG